MLPMRVRVGQMLRSLSENPAVGPRLLSLAMVIAIVAGVVASGGFSVTIQVGQPGEVVGGTAATVGSGGSGSSLTGTSPTASGSSSPSSGSSTAGPASSGSASSGSASSGSGGGASTEVGAAATGEEGGAAGAASVEGQGDRCAGAELGETDHGVTAETIEIALMTVDLARLDAIGFGVSAGEVDFPKIMDAWTNHLNANGGVACREVIYIHHETDLSEDAQIASCKELTQDRKVFAVLSPGGNVAGAPCITKDNQTPMPTALAAPERWAREGSPYLWDILQSQERILTNHVRWLVEAGEITKEASLDQEPTKVGVVYANEPYGGPSVENAMIPEFKSHGYDPKVARLPYDTEQAAAQMAQVVLDFQQSGVNHVVLPTNIIYKTQFMQQAEQQNYYPDYSEDDATVGCQDALTGTYPERSWDRTKCVSVGLLNGAPNGLTPPALQEYYAQNPFAQHADAIYLATNPEGYDQGGEANEEDTLAQQASHYLIGSLVSMWAQAAQRVDPSTITRASWGEAMAGTGAFHETVSPNPYTYGPEKWSGPDFIQIVQWHAEAGDGYEERSYRELRPFFESWY